MTVSSTSTLLSPIVAATLILTGPLAAEAATAHPTTRDAPRTASGAALSGARDAPTSADTGGVVRQSGPDGAERQSVLDYWTTERMRTARPLSPVTRGTPPGPGSPRRDTRGAPRSVTGHQSTGQRWTSGGAVTRTTGRVFLTVDGRDLTCSATVIPAENRDTVITAGHCLKDGTGSWASNWTFVPGYDDGEAPYGRYVARETLVPEQWSTEADDSFDFGMAVLHTSDSDDHVQDRTGAQRIAFGESPGQWTYAFGYPSTGGFEGRGLRYCSGRPEADQRGTTASGMPCDMTEGSSGGPWLTDFDPSSGKGTVTSVISFKYADDSSVQYGTRLGDEANRLYERATGL
ncbi:trypsin-like serine peptidase [Halostreptopolyspora alba]|uniref:Serine protease n=1 Tax=Halostreptopolyspora alba TaxID=2487137 RepID=A0A3N0DYG0_9ACTN|nr:serine protease [Nocardiopsaceae bacterium YIM 96095]